MADIVAQASFNSGEWAPNLFARVDINKYRSGAALMQNFYIDYRGGASSRMGTAYCLQAYKSATAVRIITFQAATLIGYAMEMGDKYCRFFYHGSPVLENALTISGATQANPAVLDVTAHDYLVGDWVYVSGIMGMTQLNGRFFLVSATTLNTITLAAILDSSAINSTGYTAYTSGGSAQRVYTIPSPWAAADLALVKFAQQTNKMVLTHPNYAPQSLSLISATNWVLAPIVFGSTVQAPTGVTVNTSLSSGSVNYAYAVTSIDINGQESEPSTPGTLSSKQDIRTVAGSNQITWTAATNAVAYNVYEAVVNYYGVVPAGAEYGFIGTCKSTTFVDSNIGQDFAETPPIAQNPFVGQPLSAVNVTAAGSGYSTVPNVTFSGGTPSANAQAQAYCGCVSATVHASGTRYLAGDTVTFNDGIILEAATVSGGGVSTWTVVNAGSTNGTLASILVQQSTSGIGVGAQANITWGVVSVALIYNGTGYLSTPTVGFSGGGGATATAVLGTSSAGNPGVPSYFQQRLVLAASISAPQTFNMSRTGLYYNYDISNPVAADDAITGTLVSTVQETIKSIVSSSAGMLVLTDRATWIVNGGGYGTAVTPSQIVATRQSGVGSSDVPPIVANYDILYIQAKGSAVRDLAYNIYFQVFTGTDISVTSSHFFFGYTVKEWCWAEAPYYIAWTVRNDGILLSLTYLKEQEFVGWAQHNTQGLFQSTCAVTETTANAGNVDAAYFVVQRVVNGNTVQFIERMADRVFPNGLSSAWCVDSGVQYTGAAQLSFQGAEHLAGLVCTGLATDNLGNVYIINITMPVSGFFTLPAPPSGSPGYTTVTIGLGYTCNLQTLAIDIQRMQIQGKLKKIPYVDVRVNNTLGLWIGSDSTTLVPMNDLILGQVSSMLTGQTSQIVTGLVNGDARTFLNPTYTVPGQFYIQQPYPYPATVLGVFPALVTEDDP